MLDVEFVAWFVSIWFAAGFVVAYIVGRFLAGTRSTHDERFNGEDD